jgi:hypothetical protein
MKSVLEKFQCKVLSKDEMKNLKGGRFDGCGANACEESTDCLHMHCDGGCHGGT